MNPPGIHIPPMLVIAVPLLLIIFLYGRRRATRYKITHLPLTPKETFEKHRPGVVPRDPSRLRLTSSGRVARIFAIGAGAIWICLMAVYIHGYMTGPAPGLVVWLPGIFLGLMAFVPAVSLLRDFRLQKKGQLASGLVIGMVQLSGRRGAWHIYYDFMSDRGEVLRGMSLDDSTFSRHAVGSFEPVLYWPHAPKRNALKQCLCWREDGEI